MLGFGLATTVSAAEKPKRPDPLAWPKVTREARPWTRWWWMGSAVSEPEITRSLDMFQQAGFGGVEVSPIYGVKGAESRNLPYLSPEWLKMLRYTVREARRRDLDVDMIQGTGWPFGGTWVPRADAAARVVLTAIPVGEDGRPRKPLPTPGTLQTLMAYSADGKVEEIKDRVGAGGKIDWTAPAGKWTLYAVQMRPTGQQVKRAGPGADGPAVDPFNREAMQRYFAHFVPPLSSIPPGERPGCLFNDSFEAFGANWTPGLLSEFQQRRGYDLRRYLPALMGQDASETVSRVRSDYRQTMDDLLLEDFTRPWTTWAHGLGMRTRNQAHGSPANLLDLYAATDIPETEIFGPGRRPGEPKTSHWREMLVCKLASSASHVAGKPLCSSESMTWLGEHFQVSLAEIKEQADLLFLSGVNHLFYHGTPFSPSDAEWPGWLFYASTDVTPTNPWWRDLPALNGYLARSQSFLQAGQSDNDVLLYFPIYDLWAKEAGASNLLQYLRVHNTEDWLDKNLPEFGVAAKQLWDQGYGFDFVSDRLLKETIKSSGNRLQANGASYRVLVVAGCERMPPETLEQIVSLARAGATVAVVGQLPKDVPGLENLAVRRQRLREALATVGPVVQDEQGIGSARIGKGRLLIGPSVPVVLQLANLPRERMTDQGIAFIRRAEGGVTSYFLSNQSEKPIEGWVPLAASGRSAVIFDPMSEVSGTGAIRGRNGGSEVFLQLAPGRSLVVRLTPEPARGTPWRYLRPEGTAVPVIGEWQVQFLAGGPTLPKPATVPQLASWTEWNADTQALRAFSGTARYRISFSRPEREAAAWVLDLGTVYHSARVRLNGRDLGTLVGSPYRLELPSGLLAARNELEVEVTNLMANRVADLDRRQVPWQKFYFVNIGYKPFSAATWEPLPSGLIGPVLLEPSAPRKLTIAN